MIDLKKSSICFTFLILGLFWSCSLYAQTLDKEIGVRFSGLNDFDLIYKKEVKENRWLRARAIFTNVSFSKDYQSEFSDFRFSADLGLGFEFRKPLTDKLDLIHGPEARLNYAINLADPNANLKAGLGAGLGYVAGVQYNFNSSISLGAEIIPSLFANYELEDGSSSNKSKLNIGAGFSSNAAALTLMFRFPNKNK